MNGIEFLAKVFGEHIDHQHEQVGPCVYCRTCGSRLYHGKLMTPAELSEIREAIAEYTQIASCTSQPDTETRGTPLATPTPCPCTYSTGPVQHHPTCPEYARLVE